LFKLGAIKKLQETSGEIQKREISLKYQVLLKNITAIVGVVKQSEKATEEMKSIEIPTKIREYFHHVPTDPNMPSAEFKQEQQRIMSLNRNQEMQYQRQMNVYEKQKYVIAN
jgi:hypothetical protein